MMIVDTALAKRAAEGRPIRVGLIGAGYSARHIAVQITSSFPGIQLSAIANRTPQAAEKIWCTAGIDNYKTISCAAQLEDAISNKCYCVTDNAEAIVNAENIDAIIETTGEVEYGARVAMQAIKAGKHTVVLNCELDATLGPLLKAYADKHGVVYTNTDGDEPGVARNLSRFVETIGLEVVGAGNLKGFYDVHRTPDTQREFARQNKQKPHMVTSFVDGTKLSMELTVLANASGFGVSKRGMHGPECDDVRTCLQHFPADTFQPGKGVVDFLLGASPYTGAFVIGYSQQPIKADYLKYLKMGAGPHYVFYTPFHLPQLEVPITVARAVLFDDAAVTPKGKPYCDAIAVSKRALKAGEVLDGIGGYTCYALIDTYEVCRQDNLLPMGVSQGCTMRRDLPIDSPITYDDVDLPCNRLVDQLRNEMQTLFC